jgi:hypothetical protein
MSSAGIDDITVDAFLADSVAGADGKLYVHGAGWNTIHASRFPVRHPRLGLAVLIHVPYVATNQQHRLRVQIHDPDGGPLVIAEEPNGGHGESGPRTDVGGEFAVGRPPLLPAGDEQVIPIAINIDGIVIPGPAMYSVVIEIDGTEVHRLPFRVQ